MWSSEDVTDISGLNSYGILGSSAGGLLLLNGVLLEGDLLADHDVALNGEVSVLGSLGAAFTVGLFGGDNS